MREQPKMMGSAQLLMAAAVCMVMSCGEGGLRSAQGPQATVATEANDVVSPATSVGEAAVCKRGMVVGNEVQPALSARDLQALSGGVSWWYNYSFAPLSQDVSAASAKFGVKFVPMAFTASSVNSAAAKAMDAQGGYLLAFNEPNFHAQGNLTPQQAAAAWPALEQLAANHNMKIVSPALNYCGGGCNQTDPFAWFDAFFAACPNCQVDYLAVHAYVCFAGALQSAYLAPFARYKKPLWVTEFSCLDGSADATSLAAQGNAMRNEVAAMEADPNVFRYAWFIARSSTSSPPLSLLGADGQLTALGQLYVSLPQACRP